MFANCICSLGYKMNAGSISDTENKVLTYHRIAEAFKYAYAKRTLLADEDFVDMEDVREKVINMSY